MSGPFGSSQFMYATGAAEEGQSLRFEDGDSAYLSWTPASAGNTKTWTWSGWVKRGNLGGFQNFFIAGTSGTSYTTLYFSSSNTFGIQQLDTGTQNLLASSTAVFRDPSAWYHVVLAYDSTQATNSNGVKLYINGVQQTLSFTTYNQNNNTYINGSVSHGLGTNTTITSNNFDGYLANVTFIDGTALTPTSFGEYQDTLWKPKSDTDITSLTMGTNGFYLPFKQTTEAEGFSTVTYTGTSSQQAIEGVGFEPDLVWLKARSSTGYDHVLQDSVRGSTKQLYSNSTSAEVDDTDAVTSFDSSGFTTGADVTTNNSGVNYVAWCWDAGSGSAVSNTDGSITSSVKANTAKGFSITSYTGNGTAGATIGHGLTSSAPEMVIVKNRTSGYSYGWNIYHSALGATKGLDFTTGAASTLSSLWNDTAPTSSVVTVGNIVSNNRSGNDFVMYCFHSVSGYSSFGSYSGTGSSGNSITGLGFKPAWLMIKRTDTIGNWWMLDNTRDVDSSYVENVLLADSSGAEFSSGTGWPSIEFTSDGFDINATAGGVNASGGSYIYLAFADTRDATFFGDTSGNGNNWTPNALNNTDVVPDSPVTGGNFAVMNPLSWNVMTFAEGNLKISTTTNNRSVHSTFAIPSTGKWIYEFVATDYTSGGGAYIGFSNNINEGDDEFTGDHGVYYQTYNGGFNVENTVSTATGYTVQSVDFTSDGDIHTIAIDMDNQKLYFAKNGTWRNSADPAAGTGGLDISSCFTSPETDFHACITRGGSYNEIYTFNFGQDSSFAGTKTPQGNTDDNGVGDFYYAPPSGFLALTTGNLPAPTITAPDEYFNTVLYTGTGSSRSITGVNFQPDWIWWKGRNASSSHLLMNSVVGNTKYLYSNSTSAEQTDGTNVLTSFDSDGFTLPADTGGYANFSGRTYVAWNWLAGGTAVSNTDGSITSTVSANTDAGFSVVSFTGNATAGATVGHGLSSAPEMLILKNRDSSSEFWTVFHTDVGNTKSLFLNSTGATDTSSAYWNNTSPTSSVFSLGGNPVNNGSGNGIICYAFHSVESYSKIGSYTGNGSTDGVYVHLGFRAAWVLIKSTGSSSNGWYIYDNKRENYGTLVDAQLYANLSSAEDNGNRDLDFTANGFKPRLTDTNVNGSGSTYIFLAFAEAPFTRANAR